MGFLAPAIGAAGSIGGAVLGGKAQNKATEAQAKSNAAALDFSKQQEAARRAEYDKAFGIWSQGRDQLLSRYGLSPMAAAAAPAAGGPSGQQQGAAAILNSPLGQHVMGMLQPQQQAQIASMAQGPYGLDQGGGGTSVAQLLQGQPGGDLGSVYSWNKYGLQ
jgi:hypothetical protein